MKSPEAHRSTRHRNGKKFETDSNMHYLAPGAFTVLPTNEERKSTARTAPSAPPAPTPYKLTTKTRRPHKHQSFAIIGEVNPSSNSNSRSSSPTGGRISPFKGHGFNPLGSRHASPVGSPVPPATRSSSPTKSDSRIPRPLRKNSSGDIFGEKISHSRAKASGKYRGGDEEGGRGGLTRQLSQSLSSLDQSKKIVNNRNKPPPPPPSSSIAGKTQTADAAKSPKRQRRHRAAAFKQLSPILGSSPEPSQQSLSSPSSRIPVKSKSTPPSRIASPTRYGQLPPAPLPPPSRPLRQTQSNSNLMQSSYGNNNHSNNKKYQHVQSKINSFNKPKVPPKPVQQKNAMANIGRSSSKTNLLPKTFMGGKTSNYISDSSSVDEQSETFDKHKHTAAKTKPGAAGVAKVNTKFVANSTTSTGNSSRGDKEVGTSIKRAESRSKVLVDSTSDSMEKKGKDLSKNEKVTLTKKNSSNKLPIQKMDEETSQPPPAAAAVAVATNKHPSTTTVVSSTTNTVTKPLKIQTPTLDRSKVVSPIIDGRMLSSTSVSNAINRMNGTVLDTKTLIKDSALHNRFNPAAGGGAVTSSHVTNDEMTETNHRRNNTKDEDKHKNNSKDDKERRAVNDDQANSTLKTTASNHHHHQNHNHHHHPHLQNHMTTIGLGNAKALEMEVQKNMHKLISDDVDGNNDDDNKSTEPNLDVLQNNNVNKMSANDRIRQARTVVAADVKPIKITVREKPSDGNVQSGNINAAPHFAIANGINERSGLPTSATTTPPQNDRSSTKEDESLSSSPSPTNRCKRFWNNCWKILVCSPPCQCCRKQQQERIEELIDEETSGCCPCLRKKPPKQEPIKINIEKDFDHDNETGGETTFWQKLKCCKTNKVGDANVQSCFPFPGKRKETEDWIAQQSENVFRSVTEEDPTKCCSKQGCLDFIKKLFCCIGCGSCCYVCCKRKENEIIPPRKESVISGKKKSLTPTTLPPPPEDTASKIDVSLVEHNSHMKGAIPILPVWLAWFCCIMNCIVPGTGTFLSGLFCLCIGKPRFSQKDGPKPRIGSFIINTIIGFSQLFTVLFCLVGWGWSIWWGVIMVKIAKKHRKIKQLEILEDPSSVTTRSSPNQLTGATGGGGGRSRRDIERGRT